MQSRWAIPGCASVVKSSSSSFGEALLPPPYPSEPPDPSSSLSPVQFPPLSTTPPMSRSKLRRSKLSPPLTTTGLTLAVSDSASADISPQTGNQTEIPSLVSKSHLTVPATGHPKSISSLENLNSIQNHSTFPTPKLTPPLVTSKILNSTIPIVPSAAQTNLVPPLTATHPPPVLAASLPSSPPTIGASEQLPVNAPTLADKLRAKGDKSLKRLAPVQLSEAGRPRVLIPDSVFQKGADLHKDFIICYFNGRPPPFTQIQSVLNHMWGKGRKLEIHNNPLQRSTLVRIHSEYLRQKILEKNIWYVGDSMFHTAQWSSVHSTATPSLSSIKIWAHLTGVPLDLRHQEGLSLVAGLVGDPKETDDFTLNLVSLTLSHVKVEVDLTKPLPSIVEFQRQSGEIVEVQVAYPWLPSKCSHCHELGHVVRNCLKLIPPSEPSSSLPKEKGKKDKQKVAETTTPKHSALGDHKLKHFVAVKKNPPSITPVVSATSIPSLNPTPIPLSTVSSSLSACSLVLPDPIPNSIPTSNPFDHQSPSGKQFKPSLKRSRSSPTLSPPSQPKFSYKSSSSSLTPSFPVIGTLQYLKNSPFIDPILNNPFLPLLSVDSLHPSGGPPSSS
ncbi:hypothetical protein N665_1586s0001 [Sinapis alba]|nr:hypothetical protein N665_1586s0001 [Sinapis alba]